MSKRPWFKVERTLIDSEVMDDPVKTWMLMYVLCRVADDKPEVQRLGRNKVQCQPGEMVCTQRELVRASGQTRGVIRERLDWFRDRGSWSISEVQSKGGRTIGLKINAVKWTEKQGITTQSTTHRAPTEQPAEQPGTQPAEDQQSSGLADDRNPENDPQSNPDNNHSTTQSATSQRAGARAGDSLQKEIRDRDKNARAREDSLSFFTAWDLPPELDPGELAKSLDRLWRSEQKRLGLPTYVPRHVEIAALLADQILGNRITGKSGDLTIAPLILPAAERYWQEYGKADERSRPNPVGALTWVKNRAWEAYEAEPVNFVTADVVDGDRILGPAIALAEQCAKEAGVRQQTREYYDEARRLAMERVQRNGWELRESGQDRRWM